MRASRLISLLMLLQTNGQMTAQALAAELEVSQRTIYRDLDALSAAGVPVYAERGPHGGCALMEDYRTSLTGLTADEVRSLFITAVPDLLAELGIGQTAAAAQRKLEASLPAPFQKDARRIQKLIYLDAAGWFQPPEPVPFLEIVQQGLWAQKRLRIVYRTSSGDWSSRLIAPYGLVGKAGIWYAVASSGRHLWLCRISRIEEAELTDQLFERPSDFDLAAYWQQRTADFEAQQRGYRVKLRVLEGGWRPLVQLFGEGVNHLPTEDKDHTIITLHFPSAEDACLRLLGAPPSVEVVAPQTLRHLMRDTAAQVAARYSNLADTSL